MPSIHYSSFEAGLGADEGRGGGAGDAALLGFLDQTRNVLVGVEAAIERALEEGWSMVLEGVHLVPGMLPPSSRARSSSSASSRSRTRTMHRTHFWIRDAASDGVRPLDKYLAGFADIRLIQDYIVERARAERRAGDRERADERDRRE